MAEERRWRLMGRLQPDHQWWAEISAPHVEGDGETVEVMPVEDHQRLLREVEEQRDGEIDARVTAQQQAAAANSHLEQVAQELERRAEKNEEYGYASAEKGHQSRHIYFSMAATYRDAAALLREAAEEEGAEG